MSMPTALPGSRMLLTAVLALVAVAALPGCNKQLQRERNALYMQNQELQEELDRARAALDASQGRNAELAQRVADLEAQLAQRPEPEPAPAAANTGFTGIEGVETFSSGGNVTVRVPGDVLFASGKTELRSSAKATLTEIADVIESEYAGETIRVEGYTDTDPIRKSKWTDNLELSLHRAAAVERYLTERGVSADRIYSAGFGESQPRSTKEQSRRVEIVVVLNQ
ncbi:MAG: OmpA/MotB family protein [Phycisphaeraceae bacterium]